MGTTEAIVDIDEVTVQAWKTKGVEATRREVESRLKEERRRRIEAYRREGRPAYAWGYAPRKSLLTPVGELGPLRIPRMRVEGVEVRLIPRQVRRTGSLEALTAEATISGISQRRMSGWLDRGYGGRLSAATVGRIVLALGEEAQQQRFRRLGAWEYPVVAVDGIFGRYRKAGEACLVVGIGVRGDGTFDVLDWQGGPSESADVLEALLDRLYRRGLTGLEMLVGDGAGALQAARQIVYPDARFQLCLWHLGRTLKSGLPLDLQSRFSRDFWEVYNGLDGREVHRRARRFVQRYEDIAPRPVSAFVSHFDDTLGYLHFPAAWRHRVRTVNLAEGFFRNFRRFFNRFPGFQDEAHLSRCMGLYLLGAKPQRWSSFRTASVA